MSSRCFAAFLFFTGLATLTACSPNQYATPRTLPPGKVSHTVALEGTLDFRFNGEPGDLHPRYQMRVGLAERVDLGVMVGPYFGADVKLNFLRTKAVDMAITPGVYYGVFPSYAEGFDQPLHVVRFTAPLSLGFNLTKAVSLYVHGVASGGVTFREYDEYCQQESCETEDWFVTPQVGLGVQVRLTPSIALTPELTILGPAETGLPAALHGGIGISFGAQPNYDEFDEPPRD